MRLMRKRLRCCRHHHSLQYFLCPCTCNVYLFAVQIRRIHTHICQFTSLHTLLSRTRLTDGQNNGLTDGHFLGESYCSSRLRCFRFISNFLSRFIRNRNWKTELGLKMGLSVKLTFCSSFFFFLVHLIHHEYKINTLKYRLE